MDLASEAVKMMGALLVVVILMFGMFLIFKRITGDGFILGNGSVLRQLGGIRLGPGKSIVLVEVAGEILVLGATARELTLLTRVEDPVRVSQLRPMPGQKLKLWTGGQRAGTMKKETVLRDQAGEVVS